MWREGGQSRERAAAKQAPDSEPELACHRRCSTYVLTHVRDRDKSRMRESRKSGSVRGDGASRTPTSTALLRGLDILLGEVIGIPVIVAEDPMSCVAIGTGQRAILSR